jgi:hypothetical protein
VDFGTSSEEEEEGHQSTNAEQEDHRPPPRLRPVILMHNKDGTWQALERATSEEFITVVLMARQKHLEAMWALIRQPRYPREPPWQMELDPTFVSDAYQTLKEHWMPNILKGHQERGGKGEKGKGKGPDGAKRRQIFGVRLSPS